MPSPVSIIGHPAAGCFPKEACAFAALLNLICVFLPLHGLPHLHGPLAHRSLPALNCSAVFPVSLQAGVLQLSTDRERHPQEGEATCRQGPARTSCSCCVPTWQAHDQTRLRGSGWLLCYQLGHPWNGLQELTLPLPWWRPSPRRAMAVTWFGGSDGVNHPGLLLPTVESTWSTGSSLKWTCPTKNGRVCIW